MKSSAGSRWMPGTLKILLALFGFDLLVDLICGGNSVIQSICGESIVGITIIAMIVLLFWIYSKGFDQLPPTIDYAEKAQSKATKRQLEVRLARLYLTLVTHLAPGDTVYSNVSNESKNELIIVNTATEGMDIIHFTVLHLRVLGQTSWFDADTLGMLKDFKILEFHSYENVLKAQCSRGKVDIDRDTLPARMSESVILYHIFDHVERAKRNHYHAVDVDDTTEYLDMFQDFEQRYQRIWPLHGRAPGDLHPNHPDTTAA